MAAPDPPGTADLAGWASVVLALITLLGAGLLRVLRRITRLERRQDDIRGRIAGVQNDIREIKRRSYRHRRTDRD